MEIIEDTLIVNINVDDAISLNKDIISTCNMTLNAIDSLETSTTIDENVLIATVITSEEEL